ncbi:hypothetical protein BDC45DRAFT_541437 [Circinella umbellata]|nr:hypothetical protein BDC45DRAFT_541437 [Circinella umbellata]
MIFVNQYIIRILGVRQHEGEAIPAEAYIGEKKSQIHKASKASQSSISNKKKGKGRAGKGKSGKSHKKCQKSKKRKATTSQEKLKCEKEDIHNRVKRLESKVTKLAKESASVEKERADKGCSFRKGKANGLWDTRLYSDLREVRQRVNSIERDLAVNRRDLADARSQFYALEMKLLGKDVDKVMKPDEDQLAIQKSLIASTDREKPLVIVGVDPGIVVAATATITTASQLLETMKSYWKYSTSDPSVSSSSSSVPTATIGTQQITTNYIQPPKALKYTAKQKSAANFSSKHEKRHERYKQNMEIIKGVVVLARFAIVPPSTKKIKRNNKLKSINGALRCTNPQCPAHNSSTFNRDEVGGFNIAVSGLSKSLSFTNTPIPLIFACSPHGEIVGMTPVLGFHLSPA